MRIGRKVRMTEGPFLGMHGTIISLLRRRAVLAVVLGRHEVEVEIERDWIVEATPRPQWTSQVEDPKRAAG